MEVGRPMGYPIPSDFFTVEILYLENRELFFSSSPSLSSSAICCGDNRANDWTLPSMIEYRAKYPANKTAARHLFQLSFSLCRPSPVDSSSNNNNLSCHVIEKLDHLWKGRIHAAALAANSTAVWKTATAALLYSLFCNNIPTFEYELLRLFGRVESL